MLVAGLISGTSVDGIDVAITEITGEGFDQSVRLVAAESIPYPPDVKQGVLAVSNADTHTARISRMNFLLGELFGEAVIETCRRASIDLATVELIGSHGQTIFHEADAVNIGGRKIASTMQIGEAAVIAARTGAPVVADFRTADMARGGQGAPLVPYVDYLLYRHAELGRVALNIGGISNITSIPPGAKPEQVVAFDTGPGNMIMDSLVSQISRGLQTFDEDGRMASKGEVSPELLKELMDDPYLYRKPPKSCGREQYGPELIARLLSDGLAPEDVVATATAYTAQSIAESIERFVAPTMPVDELIVSGGGWKNPQIIERLAAQMPDTRLRSSNELGIDSDAKEAIAFAMMAYETWHGRPSNLPSATGASGPAILGKISRP